MPSSQCDSRSALADSRARHPKQRMSRLVQVLICLLLLLGSMHPATAAGVATIATASPVPLISDTVPDGLVSRTQARTSGPPTLNVGSIIIAEPASETPLPIQVGPAEGLPKNSFVRIRGLPSSVALSQGHSIASGSWAIPFVGLATLRINVPVGLSGRSQITVALVTVDGVVLAEVKSSLVIATVSALASDKPEPQPKSVASIGPAASGLPSDQATQSRQSPPPPQRSEAQQRALRFVTRGNERLLDGDISTARLFYQRAVDAGLAEGALAMASSYDQVELDSLGVKGLTGDLDAARKWYEQARQMGASEADARLRRLGGR